MPYIRKIYSKQNLIYYMVYYALVLQFYLKNGHKQKKDDTFLSKKTEGKT